MAYVFQIGYLYLTNVGRLEEVMELMGFNAEEASLEEISQRAV